MNQKIFSIRLRALRKAAGLTQAELGKLLGGSQSLIKHLENGTRFTNLDTFIAIARFFNVTTDYLIGLSDDPHKTEINPKSKIA
jgi:transcriptional regulator with XRE-family HTH domain